MVHVVVALVHWVTKLLLEALRTFTAYKSIAEPPLFSGAVHDTAIEVPVAVAVTDRGADGVPTGVVPMDGTIRGVAAPAPAEFTALSRMPYAVPLVRPVMTSGLAVDDGERAIHVSPLSVEYS